MPNFPMGLINSRTGAGFQDLALNHHNSMQTNGFTQYSQKTGDNLMVSCFIYLGFFFRSWMSCVLLRRCHEAMWEGGESWGVRGPNSEKRHEIQECEASWKQVEESPVNSQRSAWNQGRENGCRTWLFVPGFGDDELGAFFPNSTRNLERKTQMLK